MALIVRVEDGIRTLVKWSKEVESVLVNKIHILEDKVDIRKKTTNSIFVFV